MPNAPLSKSTLRRSVWAKTDGKCWYCGEQTNPWWDFSVDHFNPIVLGGTDGIENLVPSCGTCNRRKSGHSLEHFREIVSKMQGSVFTPEQINYLHSKGIEPPEAERNVFYFEKMGLVP